MMVACATVPTIQQASVVIRRLHSITPVQVGIVAQAVATLSAAWRVERHDDYDGYLSIVVSLDNDDAPTFAVSGTADRIELSEVCGDVLQARGEFCTIDDAAESLIALLACVNA